MKTMQKVQRGFTLIELMIVVAIIGILAALAIPAYQDYTIKSRVGEGASLSGAFKTAIEIYWSENGTLFGVPAGVGGTTLNLSSVEAEYVSSILVVNGGAAARPQLEVILKTTTKLGEASGDCFRYVPTTNVASGGNIQWNVTTTGCTTAIPSKYLPKT